jgi:excisionase family DNA binding protein
VPEVADLLGVSPDKVLTWLRSGELVGVDVSARRGGRPRWRIADAELQRFLRARQSIAQPIVRRSRKAPAEPVFFDRGRPVGESNGSERRGSETPMT